MERTLNKYIGGKIKSLRIEHGLSQELFVKSLLEKSGLEFSASSISNIENGNQAIYVIDLYKIAEAFGKEIDYFLPKLMDLKNLSPSLNKQISTLEDEKDKTLAVQLLEKMEKMKGGTHE